MERSGVHLAGSGRSRGRPYITALLLPADCTRLACELITHAFTQCAIHYVTSHATPYHAMLKFMLRPLRICFGGNARIRHQQELWLDRWTAGTVASRTVARRTVGTLLLHCSLLLLLLLFCFYPVACVVVNEGLSVACQSEAIQCN